MQSQNQFYFLLLLCVIGVSIDSISFVLFALVIVLTVSVAVFALGHSEQCPREKLRGATVASREYLTGLHLRRMTRKVMPLTLHQELINRGIGFHSHPPQCRCAIVNVAGDN